MREIRPLDERHIDTYTEIAYNAYPSFKDRSPEGLAAYKATLADIMRNDGGVDFFGLFDDDKLITVMRLFRFRMNCFGRVVDAGGLGFLGVHLMHKRQGAAKPMVGFFEDYCAERKMEVGLLLPFRPDYYKTQGYGFGTKLNQYRVRTADIPACAERGDLRYVPRHDLDALLAYQKKHVAAHHGMIEKIGDEIRTLRTAVDDHIVASYNAAGDIDGYMVFRFRNGKAGNYTINHIYVEELAYDSPREQAILLGFLRLQADQAQLVVFNTGDEAFHYLFANPLNDTNNYIPFGNLETNTQSVGTMYKVFNAARAFAAFDYRDYNGASLCARFVIEEPQPPAETVTVRFENGRAAVVDNGTPADVTLSLDRADFSSLFMGCVSVADLVRLGHATADDSRWAGVLDRALYCPEKPFSNTDF
ncbi:GNAT family N-acetyltransferase [Ruminococcaceae bacterium OttesenSCG-928-A11]|nr:GNAT family N-acetyltransferase [Ruminococcaceae bacterium OttesenSCG-928-A11]